MTNLSFWNTDYIFSNKGISILAKNVDCPHFIPLSKFPNQWSHAQIHPNGRNISFFERHGSCDSAHSRNLEVTSTKRHQLRGHCRNANVFYFGSLRLCLI